MKYLIIKPKQSNRFIEVSVKSVSNPDTFIQQEIGAPALARQVGDYTVWIADPQEVVLDEEGLAFKGTRLSNVTPNMLINEFEVAYGNVVITSNYKVTSNKYSGLNEQDIANVMNALLNSNSTLVDFKGSQVTIDCLNDAFLAPNGITLDYYDEPVIDSLGYEKEKELSDSFEHKERYSDELFEQKFVPTDTNEYLKNSLNNEKLQEKLKNL
ncbi:hypothetical protein ACX431_000221 [Staphylococcus pseudintermedius]|nr:hypothetical protein [Staphylococcus pseudintermedius]EGQ3451684.1 hypothetical protein [Staphylococcus pseudintermedius]EGQ3672409.1 hypothetical protein [Staphylococcus pseudintermedius]EGQ3982693.1 hypothetical protein [Staphylococcus pseudintermedius]EHT3675975.1 hypothetical protein [Staphylococcus pseudintermedius]